MRSPVSVHASYCRMIPIVVIVVVIISVVVKVVAPRLRTDSATHSHASRATSSSSATVSHPLAHGSRVAWRIVAAMSHEICIEDNDPQSTLSLLDSVVATCE